MPPIRRHLPKALTQEQWLRIASDNRKPGEYCRHPRERRKRKRERIPALAAVTFRPGGRFEDETTYWNCPVVDVSDEGLSIRSYRKIAIGTRLALEIGVGDRRFTVAGKVTHSTGFVGNIQVGVLLEFPNADEQSETSDA